MIHHCHAHGCTKSVPPEMLMCGKHWHSLSSKIREAVWREYRPGQEIDKDPSARYMAVMEFAIAYVAKKEGLECNAMEASSEWRARSISRGLGDPLAGLVQ